jgi:hypothetical protein
VMRSFTPLTNLAALLAILMVAGVYARADSPDCSDSAKLLGKNETAQSLTADCSKYVFDRAPASLSSTSAGGGYRAAGYKNMISIVSTQNQSRYDFIAGSNTSLVQIQGVSIATPQKEVWILDQTDLNRVEIKIFVSKYGGNLKPLRTYQDNKLNGAKFIQVSKDGQEVAIWFPESQTIRVFSSEMPKNQNFAQLKVVWKREVKLQGLKSDKIDSFFWISEKSQFVVGESDSHSIAVFDETKPLPTGELARRDLPLKDSILLDSISFDTATENLVAILKDGTTLPLGKDL